MIPISQDLEEEIQSDSQNVDPVVKAWMSDIRYLENIKHYTSTHTYNKQILDREPNVYVRFDKTEYNVSTQTRQCRLANDGAGYISVHIPSHGLSNGAAVCFDSDGRMPTEVKVGDLKTNNTYYVQASSPHYFNINTSRAYALDNLDTGKVPCSAFTGATGVFVSISISNPAVFTTGTPHGYSNGDPIVIASFSGNNPSGLTMTTNSSLSIYYVQNATSTTFNLNTNASDAILNNSNGRVVTTGSSTGSKYAYAIHKGTNQTLGGHRVKDHGALGLDIAYGESTAGVPVYTSNFGTTFESRPITSKAIEIIEDNRLVDTFERSLDNPRTFTIALTPSPFTAPAVMTLNNHGFSPGDPVILNTTGSLPTLQYDLGGGFWATVNPSEVLYINTVTTNTFTLRRYRYNYFEVNTPLRAIGSQTGVHTISVIKKLGSFSSTGSSVVANPDLQYYLWNKSYKTNMYAARAYLYPSGYEGALWWAGGADYFRTKPAYATINLRCLDHFVDWRPAENEGNGAILRYIDENNYIYCRGLFMTPTNSIAIYKVVDGITTFVGGVNSTYFSTANIYRFQADYNTFTIYNMGQFEPTNSTSPSSTILSVYIDDPVFRTENATSAGLISFSMYEIYGIAPYSPKLIAYYFAAYGYNYLVASHHFDNSKYCYSSTDLSANTISKFKSILQQQNFTYSFLFRKDTAATTYNTIFWLGNTAQNTAIKITYVDSTNDTIVVKVFDSTATQYTLTSSNNPITIGEMAHISVIKNGTRLSLYINGQENAYITLPSNFAMRDVVTGFTPLMMFGGDYAGSGISEGSGYRLLTGRISEFAIFDYALNQDDINSMYYSIENMATLPASTSDHYFSADSITDGIPEETHLYAFANMKNYLGNTIKTNNYSICADPIFNNTVFSSVKSNYGWMSRCQSGALKTFTYQDFVKISFDSIKCNKIFISTGYMNGRIDNFNYEITKSDNTVISGSSTFGGESFKYLTASDLLIKDTEVIEIISIKIIPTSTLKIYDYARIFMINPIWEVNLSDRVISFNVDKVRDNFDASLPIGATAANNGSITFSNVDLAFNPYGTSIYGDYINPDTKFFIYLSHQKDFTEEFETIPLAEEVYADSWNVDTSSMTVEVPFRDYSKFLQEETLSGYISQGICAGRSIRDIMLESGFPARKIYYYDKFYEEVFFSDPAIFIPFFEGQEEVKSSASTYGSMKFYDECNFVYALDPSPLLGAVGSTIVYSDILSAQDDSQRVSDSLAIDAFSPIYKSGSYNPNSKMTLYKYDGDIKWNPSFVVDTAFSIACYVRYPSDLTAGNYYSLVAYQGVSDTRGIKLEYQKSTVDQSKLIFKLSAINASGTSYFVESNPVPISQSHLIHVTIPSSTSLKLYVDGQSSGTITASDIYLPSPNEFNISGQGDTYISNFAFYTSKLSDSIILKQYETSFFSIIPTFKYLYAKDSTYWDAMLNIATADLGMFYIDEYGNFRYEYRNILHQESNNRYRTSQYDFADNTNIISGSVISEVQTNKVNVKVNKVTYNSSQSGSLWSAESNESLAITSIISNVTPSSTSIQLKNTNNPIILPSGYIKINNEIIKYNSVVNNTLSNIERAQFGTEAGWHLSGDRAREARLYEIEYTDSPAVVVYYPYLTTEIFDGTAKIDYYSVNAFSSQVVVSANDPGPTSYIEDGVDYYFFKNREKTNYVILEGTNPLNGDSNFFRIAGTPTTTQQSKETISSVASQIQENIRKYRLKQIDIDNEFIGNKLYAQLIADHVIGYFSDPIKILNLNILGVPHVQLGDLVTVKKFDDIGISDIDFWVIQSSITYDGGIGQQLVLREFSATIDPPEFAFTEAGGSTPNV